MTMTRRDKIQGLLALSGVFALPACAAEPETPPSPDLIGTWSGRLEVGVVNLRLRFVVIDAKTAKVISLDQGNAEIPATSVELSGNRIQLKFQSINATYDGELKAPDRIEGTFTQGAPIPLSLFRGEAIPDVAPAEPLTPDRLKTLRTEAGTPGLAAGWQKRGSAATILADGLRSAGSDKVMTPADRFHWGSITKSMTATVAARLVEQGKISWISTLGEVLSGKKMKDAYKAVTLLQLLSHRGGLQPNLNSLVMMTYSRNESSDARAERLKYALAALDQKPAAKPGEAMIYSNSGFICAGVMLEIVTGRPWETLIGEELFGPLNLISAGFGAPGTKDQIDQPLGHTVGGDKRTAMPVGPGKTTDNPTALGPAGRVHMSLIDMLTYLRAHADQPTSYLKPESWKMLHTPHFGGDYALGWMVRADGVLWHNGSNTLWYAESLFHPATGAVACAAGNDAAPQTQKAVSQAAASAFAAALVGSGT